MQGQCLQSSNLPAEYPDAETTLEETIKGTDTTTRRLAGVRLEEFEVAPAPEQQPFVPVDQPVDGISLNVAKQHPLLMEIMHAFVHECVVRLFFAENHDDGWLYVCTAPACGHEAFCIIIVENRLEPFVDKYQVCGRDGIGGKPKFLQDHTEKSIIVFGFPVLLVVIREDVYARSF